MKRTEKIIIVVMMMIILAFDMKASNPDSVLVFTEASTYLNYKGRYSEWKKADVKFEYYDVNVIIKVNGRRILAGMKLYGHGDCVTYVDEDGDRMVICRKEKGVVTISWSTNQFTRFRL